MASNLTERGVTQALLTAPADRICRLYDAKVPGLVLLRQVGGKPRWYVFRRAGGRMHRVPVGEVNTLESVSLETARRLATGIVAALAAGQDPAQDRRRRRAQDREERSGGKVPLQQELDALLQVMATKGRAEDHRRERRYIGEGLLAAGLRDLADPQARKIAERYLNGLEVSELTRFRYGQHLKAISRFALRRHDAAKLPRDPFLGLDVGSNAIPPPALFALPELFALVSEPALETEEGRLFAWLLYTGGRLREGVWARWRNIDLDAAVMALPALTPEQRAAGERLKRNRARAVHLQPELVELARGWRSSGEFVFAEPFRRRTWNATPVFRAHLGRLGIPVEGRHVHTLRHAHCTLAVACGMPDLQLRLSVGHAGEAMSAHYAAAAMLWRAKLAPWQGVFRLREPAERLRLCPGAAEAEPGDRMQGSQVVRQARG